MKKKQLKGAFIYLAINHCNDRLNNVLFCLRARKNGMNKNKKNNVAAFRRQDNK